MVINEGDRLAMGNCQDSNQFRDKDGCLWKVVPRLVYAGPFTHTIFEWRKQTEEGPW